VGSYLHCFRLSPGYLARDWRRFFYALLNLLGFGFLNTLAINFRDRKRSENIQSQGEK